MKIDITELSKAVSKFITVEQYIVLKIIEDGCLYLFPNNLFAATIVGLKSSGYIYSETQLTLKGKELLKEISEDKMSKKIDNKIVDYKALREELQSCLFKNYRKKQVKGFGDVYFIPTETELIDSLKRFWKNYPDYNSIVKITEILKNHIENCSKKNKFSPAIRYFIIKMGNSGISSPLAAAYDDWDEEKQEKKQEFDGVNI